MKSSVSTVFTLAAFLVVACGDDATTDAGLDGAMDAGFDGGGDASVDAGADAMSDAGSDALADVPVADAAAEWPQLPPCLNPATMMPIPTELLTGEDGAGVRYRLWRCYAGQGAGFTAVYRGDAFELVTGGTTYRADQSVIEYDWTHHNWSDSLVATTSAATLQWRVEFDISGVLLYFVSAMDADGTPILAETSVSGPGL